MKLVKTTLGNQQTVCLCKMAIDPKFVHEVGSQLDPSIFEDDWARIIYGFISDYTRQYNEASISVLSRVAKEKASTIRDEDTSEAVVKFANNIESFYEEHTELFSNDKYLRDSILKWIKERNLTVLRDKIEEALDSGSLDRAEDALHKYSEVKQLEFTAVDMMADIGKIIGAYEEERGELLTLPGDLGRMTGPLSRGDIMLILGESGTGKSFFSLQIAYDAVLAGLSVLYVNLENTESQMIRRIYSNMSGCAREDKEVTIPYFTAAEREYSNDDEDSGRVVKWNINYKKKRLHSPDLEKSTVQTFLNNRVMESNGGQFLLESYAPKELTVRALERELDNLREYKNFQPDVLVVDYGDLMKPESNRDDKRIQIDSIYLGLRSIALNRNILVISPVQANRQGYGKNVKKSNIAENIGSVAHASLILGLNHTEVEKERGITRVNILKNRDGLEKAEPVVCLGCLDIGRPVMTSKWLSAINYNQNGDDEDDE